MADQQADSDRLVRIVVEGRAGRRDDRDVLERLERLQARGAVGRWVDLHLHSRSLREWRRRCRPSSRMTIERRAAGRGRRPADRQTVLHARVGRTGGRIRRRRAPEMVVEHVERRCGHVGRWSTTMGMLRARDRLAGSRAK